MSFSLFVATFLLLVGKLNAFGVNHGGDFSDVRKALGDREFERFSFLCRDDKTMCVIDYDGTVVEPSNAIGEDEQHMFRELKEAGAKIYVITAQSRSYMLSHFDPTIFSGMVFECNLEGTDTNGVWEDYVTVEDNTPVHEEIEKYIRDMRWDFMVDRKVCGFAIRVDSGTAEQRAAIADKVTKMATRDSMRCLISRRYIEYWLNRAVQNKALGIKMLKERYPDFSVMAAGDNPAIDGMMLKNAEYKYIVGGAKYPCAVMVPNYRVMVRMFEMMLDLRTKSLECKIS